MNRIVCVLSSSVFKVRVIVFVLCALVCVTCFLSGIDVDPPPFFISHYNTTMVSQPCAHTHTTSTLFLFSNWHQADNPTKREVGTN